VCLYRLGLLLLLVILYYVYTTRVRSGFPAPWPDVIAITIFIAAMYFISLRPMMRPKPSFQGTESSTA
jgi:hypothetical protein